MSKPTPEEILGVSVDQVFFDAIGAWERDCDALRELSRPRHRMDTSDEWLSGFYDSVEDALRIIENLGDQTDLLDRRIDADLVRRAMASHNNNENEGE